MLCATCSLFALYIDADYSRIELLNSLIAIINEFRKIFKQVRRHWYWWFIAESNIKFFFSGKNIYNYHYLKCNRVMVSLTAIAYCAAEICLSVLIGCNFFFCCYSITLQLHYSDTIKWVWSYFLIMCPSWKFFVSKSIIFSIGLKKFLIIHLKLPMNAIIHLTIRNNANRYCYLYSILFTIYVEILSHHILSITFLQCFSLCR